MTYKDDRKREMVAHNKPRLKTIAATIREAQLAGVGK